MCPEINMNKSGFLEQLLITLGRKKSCPKFIKSPQVPKDVSVLLMIPNILILGHKLPCGPFIKSKKSVFYKLRRSFNF